MMERELNKQDLRILRGIENGESLLRINQTAYLSVSLVKLQRKGLIYGTGEEIKGYYFNTPVFALTQAGKEFLKEAI